MSRPAIARDLALSPATVGQLTRRLIDQGIVQLLEHEPSTGGRPGQLVGLVGDAARALGVNIGRSTVAFVDVRLDGQVLSWQAHEFDPSRRDAVARLALELQDLVKENDGDDAPLLGVGVCVPGVVDRPDLGNVHAPGLGWDDVALGRHLQGVLAVPVLVENGVKALAFSELLYGQGRAHHDFVMVTVGGGAGFAAVSSQVVQRGALGAAGEIGHVIVDPDGPPCTCGRSGCLEAFVGEAGLVRAGRAAGLLTEDEGLGRLAELADARHDRALAVYHRAAAALGHFSAGLVTAYDPEVLIVGGQGTHAWRHWDGAFRQGLRQHLPLTWRDVPVLVEPWDETSWARAAAAVVLVTPFDQHAVAGRQRRQVLARLQKRVGGRSPRGGTIDFPMPRLGLNRAEEEAPALRGPLLRGPVRRATPRPQTDDGGRWPLRTPAARLRFEPGLVS